MIKSLRKIHLNVKKLSEGQIYMYPGQKLEIMWIASSDIKSLVIDWPQMKIFGRKNNNYK